MELGRTRARRKKRQLLIVIGIVGLLALAAAVGLLFVLSAPEQYSSSLLLSSSTSTILTSSTSGSSSSSSGASSTSSTRTTTTTTASNSSSSSTSTSTSSTFSKASHDYEFFIQNNTQRIEAVREWFMEPFDANSRKIGYDPSYDMVRGGYWSGGFKDGYVLIDTQLLLGKSLDYLNAAKGIHTTITNTTAKWLTSQFVNPTSGQSTTYMGNDRREVLFGKVLNCVMDTMGQDFYVPGHTLSNPIPITTALPTACASDSPGGMNIYATWIEDYYLKGNVDKAKQMFSVTLSAWTSTPGTGIRGTTGGYFSDVFDSGPNQGKCKSSRILGYWIHMARATGFWDQDSQSRTISAQVMDELWAHQEQTGAISVNYPGCKNDLKTTGESNGITILAFDSRVPSWFSNNSTSRETSSAQQQQQAIFVFHSAMPLALNNLLVLRPSNRPYYSYYYYFSRTLNADTATSRAAAGVDRAPTG